MSRDCGVFYLSSNSRCSVGTAVSRQDRSANAGQRLFDIDMKNQIILPLYKKIMGIKRCSKCGIEKSINEFAKDITRKDGLRYVCKSCRQEYWTDYFEREGIKEKRRESSRKYHWENREHELQRHRNYYLKNKEKCCAATNRWRKKDRKNNSEKYRKYAKMIYRRRTTEIRLRARLVHAFRDYSTKGKQRSSDEYGIDYIAIIHHLGPCPGNREEWHIDHIKPLSLFDFDDPEQIKQAFAPENHQWLLARDNLEKHNKYESSDQDRR